MPTTPELFTRNRHERRAAAHHERAAWRISEWLDEVPIGRSKFYTEVQAGRIEIVKVGRASLVVTSPERYITLLRNGSAA